MSQPIGGPTGPQTLKTNLSAPENTEAQTGVRFGRKVKKESPKKWFISKWFSKQGKQLNERNIKSAKPNKHLSQTKQSAQEFDKPLSTADRSRSKEHYKIEKEKLKNKGYSSEQIKNILTNAAREAANSDKTIDNLLAEIPVNKKQAEKYEEAAKKELVKKGYTLNAAKSAIKQQQKQFGSDLSAFKDWYKSIPENPRNSRSASKTQTLTPQNNQTTKTQGQPAASRSPKRPNTPPPPPPGAGQKASRSGSKRPNTPPPPPPGAGQKASRSGSKRPSTPPPPPPLKVDTNAVDQKQQAPFDAKRNEHLSQIRKGIQLRPTPSASDQAQTNRPGSNPDTKAKATGAEDDSTQYLTNKITQRRSDMNLDDTVDHESSLPEPPTYEQTMVGRGIKVATPPAQQTPPTPPPQSAKPKVQTPENPGSGTKMPTPPRPPVPPKPQTLSPGDGIIADIKARRAKSKASNAGSPKNNPANHSDNPIADALSDAINKAKLPDSADRGNNSGKGTEEDNDGEWV